MASTENKFYQDFHETDSEFNYEWTLNNFSSFTESCIKSPIFSNCASDFKNKLQWQLELYPDGENKTSQGWVDVFLISMNDFNISVYWKLTMSCNISIYNTLEEFYTFGKIGDNWGRQRYLKRVTLFEDLKQSNGILNINLKILFSKKPNKLQCNLIKDLKSLLEMEENADVTLISKDGKEHKAHKAILMCRSKVFSAMFQHDMTESRENVIKIEDVDNETLGAMLHFIYTGEVENIQDYAKKLFLVADKYELNDLKKLCEYYLSENIKIDNVLDLIEFCHTYSTCKLQEKTKDYFLQNHKEIMLKYGRDNMKNLSRFTVDELLYDLAVHEDKSESSNCS